MVGRQRRLNAPPRPAQNPLPPYAFQPTLLPTFTITGKAKALFNGTQGLKTPKPIKVLYEADMSPDWVRCQACCGGLWCSDKLMDRTKVAVLENGILAYVFLRLSAAVSRRLCAAPTSPSLSLRHADPTPC